MQWFILTYLEWPELIWLFGFQSNKHLLEKKIHSWDQLEPDLSIFFFLFLFLSAEDLCFNNNVGLLEGKGLQKRWLDWMCVVDCSNYDDWNEDRQNSVQKMEQQYVIIIVFFPKLRQVCPLIYSLWSTQFDKYETSIPQFIFQLYSSHFHPKP